MKKIILLSFVFGLIGCKESNTSLDKNLFNTTSEKCRDYLKASLKSPSSLNISQINVSTNIADSIDISSVFGDLITKDGIVEDSIKAQKVRFRELVVDIDYEAQNSFGASLRGLYQCKYLFRLDGNEISPKPLNTYLYKFVSDGKDIDLGVHIPLSEFTGSNFFINREITKIIGSKDSDFNKLDEENYQKVQDQYELIRREKEADRLKKSWSSTIANDVEAAARAAAEEVANFMEASNKAIE
ncbi:hypothetical protein [Acinetobacter haemolyticus]|uniref:hypothetical protein n=2 Tax=Acinetobacter haemolyticus TaxID=29430 RepID=UPI00137286B9|nr:hypothetical protein [Acinetobacter haemolyticus]NAR50103.1 hypothetical protein [Acinetobacter haemolyticus]